MIICETCPLWGLEITEDQLGVGWCRLVVDAKTREKLVSDRFKEFDADIARVSTDPNIHRMAAGRAIALCLERHSDVKPDCPRTPLSEYSNIDDPNFPINL